MTRRRFISDIRSIADRALELGARRKSLLVIDWDVSGDCLNRYYTELWGAPSRSQDVKTVVVGAKGVEKPLIIDLWTRCRRCVMCLRARSRRWYGAAVEETRASSRTWFGTLTLSPDEQFRLLSLARAKLAKQGVDFDRLKPEEQFLMRHSAIGPEITKYIKRVRKNSGAALRYLLVAEAHESGLPHYHMLVHESNAGGTIPHRILSQAWGLGFEKWRLTDPLKPKTAAYLCKYLSKSLSARVRASQGYGAAYSSTRAYAIEQLEQLLVYKSRL